MVKTAFEEMHENLENVLAPPIADDWPNLPIDHAKGAYLFEKNGKKYLDFLAGFGATNIGHNHPKVVAAATQQLSKMIHAPVGVIAHEPLLELAV